jgi:hypothetical protein
VTHPGPVAVTPTANGGQVTMSLRF